MSRRGSARRPVAGTADILKVLAGDVRRALLFCLTDGPRDVSTLSRALQVDITGASHHLARLYDAGLVDVSKQSTRRIYRLAPSVNVKAENDEQTLVVTSGDGGWVAVSVPASGRQRSRQART